MESLSMEMVWMGTLLLMTLSLLRRHGWEYVPLMVMLGAGRWYAGSIGLGAVADGPALAAIAGVWFVTKMTRDDRSWDDRS